MLKYLYIFIAFVFICQRSSAQGPVKVEGLVIDYLSSKPIKDANVSIKGSLLKNVNTKDDGTFSIEVPSAYTTLLISYPGYQIKEASLSGQKKISVTIVPENLYVGESIVKLPYGTYNEKDLHGAYNVVFNTNDRARDLPELLQGKVAGLESNAYSGTPGEGSKFNLRGIRSLYTTNDPLIVLDGIPLHNLVFNSSVSAGNIYNNLSDINVKDIASVTILKDASAVGIYGTRAANGAFLITTKDGTNGKTYLDVSMQNGITTRFKELPMMSSTEYLPYLSSRLYSQGLATTDIQTRFPIFNVVPGSSDYVLFGNNTNWQREISQNAITNDFYVNLRGGDATSKYSFQVGYNDAQGNIQEVTANRFTSRFNLDFKILKNFSAGAHISFSRTQKNIMDQGFSEGVNPLYLSLVKPSVTSPYIRNSQGANSTFFTLPSFDNLSNPVAVVKTVTNDQKNFWVMGSVYGQYNFSSALNSKAVISLDQRSLEEDRFTPALGLVPMNLDTRYDRTSAQQMVNYQVLRFEHTLTYDKQLGTEHRLLAFGGYNVELSNASSIYGFSSHSSDDAFQALGDGALNKLAKGSNESYHNMSAFANAEYAFREKLFLKAGIRLDGSSKFGENAGGLTIGSVPFAVLPYANISWKLKSEPWMQNLTFVDELTLRASAGKTANQDIPVDARYTLYGKAFDIEAPGLAPVSMGNNEVRWETTNSFNGGLDLSVFKKAVTVNFDYFNTTTNDLLVLNSGGGIYGQSFWDNAGSIKNQGFELGVSTLGHSGEFQWNVGVNVAKYINKVKSLPNGPIVDGINGYQSIAKVGSPAGLIYGYKYMGVFSTSAEAATSAGTGKDGDPVRPLMSDMGTPAQAGDVHYEDVNHDGMISDLDEQVIGNPNPKLFGGLNGSVSYKNFDLSTVFSFSYGNDVLNVLRSKLENGGGYENQSVTALSRWTTEGDVANIPVTAYGDPLDNRRASSYYIEDGSYLKMRTLTLAYNIRKPFHFIRNAQLYLTGYNLLTFTNYSGWDPEVSIGQSVFSRGYDFGNVPQSKTFMLGIKLGL